MRQSFGVAHTKLVSFRADEFLRKRDQKAWVFFGVILFFQKDHSIRRTLWKFSENNHAEQ